MNIIKDLMAKVSGLEARAEAAFKAEVAELRGMITGALTECQTSLTEARATLQSIGTSLSNGLEKFKIQVQSDIKAEAMVEKLTEALATANKDYTALHTEHAEVLKTLRTHLASIPGHEDYAEGKPKANATLTELITAETNAVNTAIASKGVNVNRLPVTTTSTTPAQASEVMKHYEAITDSTERVKFYKANREAIDAHYRNRN